MFSVEIWGTVSSWVGSGLTGGGVLIAGLVYWRDSNLSRAAQAKKIHARIVDPIRFSDPKVHIYNYSESKIFDVVAEAEPVDLYTLATDLLRDIKILPSDSVIEEANNLIKDLPDSIRVRDDDAWTIDPGSSNQLQFEGLAGPQVQIISVLFTDIRGQRWKWTDLRDDNPRLQRVKKLQFPMRGPRFYMRHPTMPLWNLLSKLKIRRYIRKKRKAELEDADQFQREMRRLRRKYKQYEAGRGNPTDDDKQ